MSGRAGSLALFFLCSLILAQAQLVPFEKYTSKQGLIADRITAIAQDEKGFMWFGSYFGICRYDGIRFEKIALPAAQQNKYVSCLLASNGKMYAGFLFGGGLAEYANGQVKRFFIQDAGKSSEFLCMADNGDGGILLCNSSGEIFLFKNQRFRFVYKLPLKWGRSAKNLLKDRNHTIWVGTEQGLFLLPFPYTQAYPYFEEQTVFSLAKDAQEHIWFCRTNGKKTLVQKATASSHGRLPQPDTITMADNLVAVGFAGNMNKGIWTIDHQGRIGSAATPGQRYQLPVDPGTGIHTIFSDREQNIWIANEPGVLKISNFTVQVYSLEENAAGGGALRVYNDSLLFVSNSKHLYAIGANGIKKLKIDRRPQDHIGLLYHDRGGKIWIGFWEGGLLRGSWKDGRLVTEKYFREFKGITIKATTMVEDQEGNSWVAGANGLFRIKDGLIVENHQPASHHGRPAFINCMAIDEKTRTLWLGDNALGVIGINYHPRPDGAFWYEHAAFIDNRHGLKDGYIRSLFFDHERTLWIGTRYGGIYRLNENNNRPEVTDCNQAASVSCTRITGIAAEDTTAVWFASCDGLYRYSHRDGRWSHYNTSDGVLNAEVFAVCAEAEKGLVWALSTQGLSRIRLNEAQPVVPPLISITAIHLLGKPDTAALTANRRIRYAYSQNSIGFVFSGSSFIDEKKISYKYMLEGYDEDWSPPGSTNSVTYASLPPGRYSFKVMAANAKGQWSGAPASFSFEIVLPLYQRPWFLFLSVSLLLLIIYWIRIQQLKQKYRIEKLRLAIARDLHDDVGSTLGSINILSQTAVRKLKQQPVQEEISPIFRRIGESAETTLEAMDDIVWSINPDKDQYDELLIRMRQFAIPLFEARNVSFVFETSGDERQAIPMKLRRNIFLIFKESIHNILKHSGATHVAIDVKAAHRFCMEIRDNGKGFDVLAPSQRNGLKNMQQRAAAAGGRLDLHANSSGTTISFSAPLR